MNIVLVLALAIGLSGCASRSVKVLDATWVSMKHADVPPSLATLKSVGSVEERYCMESWSGSYGLMDEAVKKAEKNHNLDYIRNASFTQEVGRSCVSVVGQGYRIIN